MSNSSSGSFQQKALQQALTFHQVGNASKEDSIYRQLLSMNTNNPEVQYYLGILLHQKGMNEEAVDYFKKAISCRPNFIEAHKALIDVLLAQGKNNDVVASYRQLLTLLPDNAEENNAFGVFLYNLGILDEALIYFRKAVAINPGYATAHHNIGNILRELGNFEDAIVCYNTAISLRPNYVEAFRILSLTKKYTEINEEIIYYKNMYMNGKLSDEKKINLGFALAKIHEDLKEYDQAFIFLLEANSLKRRSYRYSVQTDYDLFERIKQTFSSNFLALHKDSGIQDKTPIFILGMPRSGSTLIERIIASHPQVFGAGEIGILPHIIYDSLPRMKTKQIPEGLADFDSVMFARMGSNYIEKIREHAIDAQYITDKNPYNFLNVGLIKTILPNAKVIHSVRNPMDNCLSIFKNYFVNNKTCKFAYDLTELGQYYSLYRGLMEYWEQVLPGFLYSVKYEELTSDPEDQISKLLKFCGLSLVDDCFSFHKKDGIVKTTSFLQVRQPIYRDSVESWRRYDKQQLEPLEKALELPFNNSSPPEFPPN